MLMTIIEVKRSWRRNLDIKKPMAKGAIGIVSLGKLEFKINTTGVLTRTNSV